MSHRNWRFWLSPLLLIGLAGPGTVRAQPAESSCQACHRALGDARLSPPVEKFADDVHAAAGFDCVACHGGDGEESGFEAMDPEKGYIGVPARTQIAGLCGRCHSDPRFMKRYDPSLRVDQVAEYRTSVHGQRLESGDPNVATCVGCHPAHSIRPPSDPQSSVHPLHVAQTCGRCHADPERMRPYEIPTDQLERYTRSVHWEALSVAADLSAPTCNDCHGNHGAAPPGISWIGNVCGHCHAVMADLFSKSVHAEIFTLMGSPGCATCHRNHDIAPAHDDLLGLEDGAICASCHSAGDPGGQAATAMRTLIDSLRSDFEQAHGLLSEAENAGIAVSAAQFELEEARTHLVGARTAVHAFAVDAVQEKVQAGLEVTARAKQRGEEAFDELRFRRTGLAVSAAIILVLIAALLAKIRELDRRI